MEFERLDTPAGNGVNKTSDAKAAAETWSSQSRLAAEASVKGNPTNSGSEKIGATLFHNGVIWERAGGEAIDDGRTMPFGTVAEKPIEQATKPAIEHNAWPAPERVAPEEVPPLMPPNLSEYRQTFFEEQPHGKAFMPTVETSPPALPKVEAEAAIETQTTTGMSQSELVKLAKTIKVDGVRLKDIFTERRIDETGLRAVIETYLRGGDIRAQLAQEIIAKEQSFERDPYLRKQQANGRLSALMAGASSVAKDVAGERGAKLAESSQKTVHKAGQILVHGAKQAQTDLIDNSSLVDWISVTAIIVVYALILILLIT